MKLASLVLPLLLAPLGVSADETLRIRADLWCPYNCDPSSSKPGYMIDVLKEVFATRQIQIDYQTMTWSRAVLEAQKGSIEAVVGAAIEDAPDLVFPKLSFGRSSACFFVRNESSWRYTGIESLAGIRLGAIQDYSYSSEVDAFIQRNKRNRKQLELTTGEDAAASNVRKALAGRVDAFLEDRQVVAMIEQDARFQNQLKEVGCIKDLDVYVAFAPNHPKTKFYLHTFDSGLAKLRSSGRLEEILKQYGLKDWAMSPRVTERKR